MEITEKNTINSVKRAIRLLSLYKNGGRYLGIAEMSKAMDLPKATVFRLVHSLEAEGWLVRGEENSKYRLGFEILTIAGLVRQQYELKDIIASEMERLKNQVDETVILAAYSYSAGVCVDKIDPVNRIKLTSEPGQVIPLHAGATGKVILANVPEEERERILSKPLERYTANTITDPEVLREEMDRIRRDGYVCSYGETNEGSIAIGVPVFNTAGRLIYGLSIAGPRERMESKGIEFLKRNILETVGSITKSMELLK